MTASGSRRKLLLSGFRLNLGYKVFAGIIQFAVMMVLVRTLSPIDYGEAAVVSGLLSLLNVFCVPGFMRQALQLPDGAEPDWSEHFSAGLYIQLAVSATAHLMAGVCWLSASHRPVAPLLHIAAVGILLDWPNQLGGTMCLRELNFRRMRVVEGAGMLARQGVTLTLAISGAGAYSIVLGSIIGSVPFMIDLLLVRKWRPRPNWWRGPDWAKYQPALRFGYLNIASGILESGQNALSALILPTTLGYKSIGLWGRAQGLYTTTIGQCQTVLFEMSHALLPRYRADRVAFAKIATDVAAAMFVVLLPVGALLAVESVDISRLLYGAKWLEADPLLAPGVLAGIGATIFNLGSMIFLALGQLRTCLRLSTTWALLTLTSLAVPMLGGDVIEFAWSLALLQLVAASISMRYAGAELQGGWMRKVVAPAAISTALALMPLFTTKWLLASHDVSIRVAGGTIVYALALGLILRLLFPYVLHTILAQIRGSAGVRR